MICADENEFPLTLDSLARQLRYARGSDQAKAAAKAFTGKPLINFETGFTAKVSGGSLKKMLSKSAAGKSVSQQAHHQAIANADKLFALATRRRMRKATQDRDIGRIEWLHHFDSPMPFEGEVVRVKILVKEMTDRSLADSLYTLSAVKLERPSVHKYGEFNFEEVDGPRAPDGFGANFERGMTS